MKNIIFLGAMLTTLVAGGAFAQDTASPTPRMKKEWSLTPEQRQNMAKMHEQMAACLRSDKPLKQCHDEMRKSCEAMGKDACPMMGWEHGKGMKHHKGMMHDESSQ